ncbi:nicotinate-nucleotide adenylyltransferase [Clostridiales Family XIII bacterium PM5-7]
MSEIGILGGTFDPFHNGHLSIAEAAIKEFHLSKVILLPAKVQPFKLGKEMASETHRVNMVKRIAERNKHYAVSTIEAYSDSVSYTAKTMKKLQEQFPKDKLLFILGADSFLCLDTWYMGKELLSQYAFIVGMRPDTDIGEVRKKLQEYKEKYHTEVSLMNNALVEISSTEIKKRIREKQSIRQLVPPQIERYIDEHQLYK